MKEYIYIITPLVAWVIAQSAKHLFARYNRRRRVMGQSSAPRTLLSLAPSGGMPSAHSATVVSLATIIGLQLGLDSPVFAVALLFAAVVMYDAMMVRFSSGEQGDVILAILKHLKSDIKKPKIAKGHLPLEVLAGACIGIVVAVVVFLATK